MDDLNRFIEGQSTRYGDYETAYEEISKGRKVSHWIWYVFPQLKGLGHSRRSIYYGIADRKEAEAYLRHPVLGERLREITNALLRHEGRDPEAIFGSIDANKVRSCMTLFDCISPNDIFGDVLDIFYEGKRDPNSIV
ncbi:MAG: DUF1810 domain-containing protein [Bacteroidales bacterium]|nr:DUF1810 domain-containing protein [Bacteroidales bacterium]